MIITEKKDYLCNIWFSQVRFLGVTAHQQVTMYWSVVVSFSYVVCNLRHYVIPGITYVICGTQFTYVICGRSPQTWFTYVICDRWPPKSKMQVKSIY